MVLGRKNSGSGTRFSGNPEKSNFSENHMDIVLLNMIKYLLIILLLTFTSVSASEIIILPTKETDPVFSSGDAADDPAFWYNQKDPSRSVIFGTDKKSGLHSFSLEGKRMQFISSGKINNIDSRSGYSFGAKNFSILAGSNASNNSIIIYFIYTWILGN